MPYIYKITNKINDKIYVGKTLDTIENRWREHKNDYQKRRNEKRPLYSAMRKYGIDNFFIEKIEECSIDEINSREIYWIKYYNSFKNGYNATKGGDGKHYLDYDLIYNTYMQVKSIKETAKLCHCDIDSVRRIILQYGITEEDIKENQRKKKYKPVAKIDPKTNQVLEIFASISEAEEKCPQTKGRIGSTCKGKQKTCGGFKWKYL